MRQTILGGIIALLLLGLMLLHGVIPSGAQNTTATTSDVPSENLTPLSRQDVIATGIAATLTARIEQTTVPLTLTAERIASFTATFTLTPSHTPTSTRTPTNTRTYTPSRTPTNTRTFTPAPTLSDEQVIATAIAATETQVANSVIALCSATSYSANAPRTMLTNPAGPFTVYQFGTGRAYYSLFQALDPAQRVTDAAQAGAVFCVKEARKPLETCEYDKIYKGTPLGGKGSIIREQLILTVYLIDVPTKTLVTYGEFLAPPPPFCPLTVEASQLGTVLRSPIPNISYFRALLPTLLGQPIPTPSPQG